MPAKPDVDKDGVPHCSRDACPEYDGKRCRLLGQKPGNICEPRVVEMAATIYEYGGSLHGGRP